MNRISVPSTDQVAPQSQQILNTITQMMGMTPNVAKVLAQSPAALSGWFELMKNLSGVLDAETRNAIALAVSQVNGCVYCLSAHTFVSKNVAKMSSEEIDRNRRGESGDKKRGAAVAFAKKLVELRGKVSDSDVAAVKAAGFSEQQIVEIIVFSVQALLTNFVNNAADTPIDFPAVNLG